MDVGTLKKYLSKYDDSMEVRLHDKNGEPVLFTCSVKNSDVVYLLTETDVDMADEIQTRLDSIKSGEYSDLEVYAQMLEQGITSDMVRKYIGEDEAHEVKLGFMRINGLRSLVGNCFRNS